MQLPKSVATKAALTLLLADATLGEPIATIEPCKAASSLNIHPITVTSQFQPVSTCQATTACIKGQCTTIFPFTTYPYVSTVVPHAWNGTTTQKTTITEATQPFRVSEHLETLTTVTAAPTGGRPNWIDWVAGKKGGPKPTTLYETVTRRAVVPFNECGPLAIPGWEGSGACAKCAELEDGSRSQLLDVVECRYGVNGAGKQYQKCAEWFETIVSRPAPSSTVTASALCSSQGRVPGAGTYTWTFPQTAPPVTITAPPRTVTITLEGRKTVTVEPKYVYTIPGRGWNAYVTRSFTGPSDFKFNVYITKVIIFNIPYHTQPAGSTRHIPVPTGSKDKHEDGWWPLPKNNKGEDYYGGGKEWADWAPTTKSTTTSTTSTGSKTSYTSKTSIYTFTTSSSASASLGPITQTTTTSNSVLSTTTSTSSSFSISLGPIPQSTTTSSATSSLSLGPIPQSTTTSSSSFSLSLGPIIPSTTSSSSVSTLSSSSRAIDSPIEASTTSTSTSTVASSSTTSASSSFSLGPVDQSTTSSASSISSTTSASSSLSVGPIDQSTTSSATSSFSSTTSASSSFSVGPIDQSTTSSSSASSSFSVDPNQPSTTTTSSSTSIDGSPPISTSSANQGSTTSSSLTSSTTTSSSASFIVDPNQGSTTTSSSSSSAVVDPNSPSTTSASSSTTSFLPSSSSTTSAPATTTTAAGPICSLTVNVCLGSPLITANTVVTQNCPLLGGLLCTVNQLLNLVPALTGNPNVASILVGANQVLGLSITPQQVQAAVLDGTIVDSLVCSVLQQVSVTISDPTCPVNPTTSSSSTFASSTSSTLSSTSASTSTALTTTSTATDSSTISSSTDSSTSSSATTLSTTSSSLLITSASSTTLSTVSSTTSAPATTTTAGAPICNLALSICPNSVALAALTISTVNCPLGIGLLCTVNQLLSLVPQLVTGNPNVLSVVLGDNQLLGLSITPSQVQALVDDGTLTSTCTLLQQINVVVTDPTCPIGSTSTTTSLATTTTAPAVTTTTTAPVITTTTTAPAITTTAVTTTNSVATTTSAPPAATTTAAGGGGGGAQQCGVQVQLCAGQTLASLGFTQVSCSLGIPVLCTLTQVLTDVTNACLSINGGCQSVGRIGAGLNILGATGLAGTQTVAQIQAAVAGVQNCVPNQILTLSDPGCGPTLFKRHGGAGHRRRY